MISRASATHFHHSKSWLVILAASLFFFYEFIQMQMFNSISGSLMSHFDINGEQLGNLSAMYLYGNVLFLFPAGLILDRVSTRQLILYTLVLCIAGTLGFAIAHHFWQAALSRILAGVGNAFGFLSCMRLAARWFPSRMLAFVVGVIVTIAMLGGVCAQTPLTLLTHYYSWQEIMFFNAALGVIIFFVIFMQVQDYPETYEKQHQAQQQQLESLGFFPSIGLAIRNPQNWLGGCYTSCLNLPIMLLGALWGNLYLEQVHHLTDIQASSVVSMIFIGMIIGSPLVGAWSDLISLRKFPMILGAIFSLISILVLIEFQNLTYIPLLILFFSIGFFTSVQVLSYPLIAESNNRIVTSTATAWASFIIMGGAALSQPLFGLIIDHFWNGLKINGVNIYSSTAFEHAMLLFPITFLFALICAFFVKETQCREFNSHHQTRL